MANLQIIMPRGGKRAGAGRPKGSKNKVTNVFGRTVESICELHGHHPTEFLVQVANGTEQSEDWTPEQRLRVNLALHQSIHNNKAIPGAIDGEVLDGQFSLVFEESGDPFALPGQGNAEGIAETVRQESL